ncbi:MAG: DUF2752 domain-containing protein [Bacteroidetes bacterium]|nr:DUF2752 domain-containing protein [Bacteroidota bacterium]MDA1121331.1 DUF2752 domain-containing protein [Bacteroidota bacterium]
MIDKIYKIGLPLVIVSLAALLLILDPVTYDFPSCLIREYAGIYCPGCGSQRAVHALLNGHFKSAFNYNPLIYFGLVIILYNTSILSINRFSKETFKNILNRPYTPVVVAAMIILFGILRNIPVEPFSFLAPH